MMTDEARVESKWTEEATSKGSSQSSRWQCTVTSGTDLFVLAGRFPILGFFLGISRGSMVDSQI